MDHHFRAFSFVDRITAVQPGAPLHGRYTIPAGVQDFPLSLVGEAVGQLAAWAAMAAVQFQRRPVAGIAGAIDLLAPVRPGQELELSAELQSVDAEAVSYLGSASTDGTPVLKLRDCVGPMVPLEDFDDPRAVRDRFALICNGGAAPGAFGGVPSLALEITGGEAGQSLSARLQVPTSAALFADHFPRRPVFPGSLLMHMNQQLAAALAPELPVPTAGARWSIRTISDMKLRAFIPPGELLDLEARLTECSGNTATVSVETRNAKRLVGAVRFLWSLEACG